jgi:hypothetical protein
MKGGGAIGNTVVKTNGDGLATVGWWTLGRAPGNQTLTASSTGLADVVFTAIAETGPLFETTAVRGNDQIAAGCETLPRALHPRVTDAFGNPIVGAPVPFTVLAGDGRIENGVAASGSDGVAVSGPWTLGPTAGVQQVRAESGTKQVIFLAHAYVPPSGCRGSSRSYPQAMGTPTSMLPTRTVFGGSRRTIRKRSIRPGRRMAVRLRLP